MRGFWGVLCCGLLAVSICEAQQTMSADTPVPFDNLAKEKITPLRLSIMSRRNAPTKHGPRASMAGA